VTAVDIASKSLSIGTVLVDAAGKTLYTFAPDMHAKATCVGSCASVWPPLLITTSEKPAGTGAVSTSLLGTDAYPGSAEKIVTYDGWPLYTFSGDGGPGSANGQALDVNGGDWYTIAPSGTQITKK
jgi:predicted lipoprotein with Yx(FWY)xxD motif